MTDQITTATPLGLLLLAIGNNRDAWAARQAPAGEDNADRDQEEADSVVETLDGLLTTAFTSGAEWHDAPLVLVLGKETAQLVFDGVELLQPDGSHARAMRGQLVRELGEYLEKRRAMVDASPFPAAPLLDADPLALTDAAIMALRQCVENEGEEIAHRDYDDVIAADGARAIYAEALGAVETLERLCGFPPKTASPPAAEIVAGMEEALGGPTATPERVEAVRDRLASIDHEGIALARVRRDAQNIAAGMAEMRAASHAGPVGDVTLIDQRVDEIMRSLEYLAGSVDRLAEIAEERR